MITARYLGDASKTRVRHVHDLENAKPSCSLQSIKWANHEVQFSTLKAATDAGYVPCLFCLPYEKGAS